MDPRTLIGTKKNPKSVRGWRFETPIDHVVRGPLFLLVFLKPAFRSGWSLIVTIALNRFLYLKVGQTNHIDGRKMLVTWVTNFKLYLGKNFLGYLTSSLDADEKIVLCYDFVTFFAWSLTSAIGSCSASQIRAQMRILRSCSAHWNGWLKPVFERGL